MREILFRGKRVDNNECIKLECNAMYETSCQSIGKTVFFTKGEAKKPLRRGEETNDL